jgi:hypothetical protein
VGAAAVEGDVVGEEDIQQLIQELSRGVVEGQLRNLRHYNELRELITLGAVDQAGVYQAYRSYVSEVSAEYKQRITDLSVRYYADLFDLGNEFSRRFYDRVLEGSANGRSEAPGPTRPVPVELSGPLGGQADTRFEIANDRGETVDVSFLVSPLRGPDGSIFRPIAIVEPNRARVQHGEVLSVLLRIILEPGLFRPDQIYTGTLEVIGFPDVALALSIWASEPVPVTSDPVPVRPEPTEVINKAVPRPRAAGPRKAAAKKAAAGKSAAAKAPAAKATRSTPRKAAARKAATPTTSARKAAPRKRATRKATPGEPG